MNVFSSLRNILSYCSLSFLILLQPLSLLRRRRQQHVLPLFFLLLRVSLLMSSLSLFLCSSILPSLSASYILRFLRQRTHFDSFLSFFFTSFLHFLHRLESMLSIPRKSGQSSLFLFLAFDSIKSCFMFFPGFGSISLSFLSSWGIFLLVVCSNG